MACGEFGPGRMAEPPAIVAAIDAALGGGGARRPARARDLRADARADRPGALHRQPLVGPAGHARSPRRSPAAARASPSSPARPRRRGRSAPRSSRSRPRREMLAAVEAALPADAAVFAAAVADWHVTGGERQQDEEGGGRAAAGAGAGREPRHPAHRRRPRRRPAAARRRLRRRDRRRASRTPSPSGCARAPTGSSPTTSARRPGSWAAPRTR